MNVGLRAVNADLNLSDAQFAEFPRAFRVNQKRVGFQADIEMKRASEFQQLKKVCTQKDFAAAEGEKQCAGLRQLLQHILDFLRLHLAVIFMIQIAVDAPFVATVRKINVDAPGEMTLHRSANQAVHYGSV